jgi:hypothetical protein
MLAAGCGGGSVDFCASAREVRSTAEDVSKVAQASGQRSAAFRASLERNTRAALRFFDALPVDLHDELAPFVDVIRKGEPNTLRETLNDPKYIAADKRVTEYTRDRCGVTPTP